MKAKVTYQNGKHAESIDLYSHDDHVGHAFIEGSTAVITKMMPHCGDNVVTGQMCLDAIWTCENLDCVQAAKFGDANE